MLLEFLRASVQRHVEETLPLIEQLQDEDIRKVPYEGGKPIGEIILHMFRSFEFYTTGVSTGEWKPASYRLDDYDTRETLTGLVREIGETGLKRLEALSDSDLSKTVDDFNRPATIAEILHEMVEHSIHHRGQLAAYYRLLDIDLPEIPYII
jgi:uncharacterized damage-inducible protein DinB